MLIGVCINFFNGFENGLLRGIGAFARQREAWTLSPAEPRLQAVEGLLGLNPRGILIRTRNEELLRRIVDAKVPVVNMSNPPMLAGVGRICNDNHRIGEMAAEHFLSRGHTRFGYYPKVAGLADPRLEGFEQRLRAAGYRCEVFEGTREDAGGSAGPLQEARLNEWLPQLPLPTALFCNGDRCAWIAAERCRALKLHVPEDIAILGVDNVEFVGRMSHLPLSSIQTAADRIGYEASAMLERMIESPEERFAPIQIPPVRVVTRRSTDSLAVSDDLVRRALEHMQSHLVDTDGLLLLCEQLGVSRRTLERRCRQELGFPPAEAWTRFRLEEAQRLLADTELSLTAIARQCGFHSRAQMASVFKRLTGRTPREFQHVAQPREAFV